MKGDTGRDNGKEGSAAARSSAVSSASQSCVLSAHTLTSAQVTAFEASISLVLLVTACGTPSTPAQGRATTRDSGVAPSATAPTLTTAPASASATTSAGARLVPRASTPNKIQCETLDCDARTEVCCVVERSPGEKSASCAPRLPPGPNGTTPWTCPSDGAVVERRCDEAADCPSGQRCCAVPYQESNLGSESCDTSCGEERCLAGSVCLNGNACAVDAGGLAGECPRQIKPAICGGHRCKTDEKCCYSADQQRGSCAAECEEGATRFECTSPDQCESGHNCSTWPGSQQYRCGGSGFEGGVLCRTLVDCPHYLSALGVYDGAPTAKRCEHSSDLPSGVRACVYE
ncbi:MAG: hypothetical protein U0271_36680 [Polyangiaceae bacterium]